VAKDPAIKMNVPGRSLASAADEEAARAAVVDKVVARAAKTGIASRSSLPRTGGIGSRS
jgi:hypothetical protein